MRDGYYSRPDQGEVEEFLEKVVADASGLAATIMAALGDRLGLFKDLATHGSSTSEELAARTGIHARYAEEWLKGMTSAGYLEFDPTHQHFDLPDFRIPVLAEEGGPYFVGGTHQMLLGMLGVVDLLEQAFRTGDGIPMSAYDDNTWEGMERDMAGLYEANLIPKWIPAMPDVRRMLERGVSVADIGCGSGRVLILMAQAFPKSRYVGFDLFEPLIDRADANAEDAGVTDRVRFEVLDATAGLPKEFDLITTFDVVHEASDPVGLLRSIREALRPGDRYVCLEVNCSDRLEENVGPLPSLRYGFSLLFCMSTSLAAGGVGLGTMGLPESKMKELCQEAGFRNIRPVPLGHAVHSVYEVTP